MPAERMTAGDKQWTASNTRFEGGMGIDATVPFGYESDFLRPVYPVDKVKPEDFFTKKDIENAKSRMQRLGEVAGADGAVTFHLSPRAGEVASSAHPTPCGRACRARFLAVGS